METNKTLKYDTIDSKLITAEEVKLGQDLVTLIKYNNASLTIQGPKMSLTQGGLPPGKMLANGKQNDYYVGEEQRYSIKLPLDATNASVDGNNEEIEKFIQLLKNIDNHIKTSPSILKLAHIEEEDIEKYTPIFRKPKANKKKGVETKEKYPYMKVKLDVNYNNKKDIRTLIYDTTDDKKGVRVTSSDDVIYLSDLEKLLTYNCVVQPVIQFSKIWTQSTGAWGVTLKLKALRITRPTRMNKVIADFLDDDDDENVITSKQTPKQVSEVAEVSSSDDDKIVIKKSVTKKVESESDGSDSEEVKPVKVNKQTKPIVKKVESESDGSDSEEIKPVKVSKTSSTKSKVLKK